MTTGQFLHDSIGHSFGIPQVQKSQISITPAGPDKEIHPQYYFPCIIRDRHFFGLVVERIK